MCVCQNIPIEFLYSHIICEMASETGVALAIVGYRDYNDYKTFEAHVNEYIAEIAQPIQCIISGGCRGVDKMGERFAQEHQIKMIVLHPDWKKYPGPGYKAYVMRDQKIAAACSHLIGFPSDAGKGTQHTIRFAQQLKKHTKVIKV